MALTERQRTDNYLRFRSNLTPAQRRRINKKREHRDKKIRDTPKVVKVCRATEHHRARTILS